jgi:hypothetical protein
MKMVRQGVDHGGERDRATAATRPVMRQPGASLRRMEDQRTSTVQRRPGALASRRSAVTSGLSTPSASAT